MNNDQSGTAMITKFFLPIVWVFGLIIFGISIAGIVESQYVVSVHLFVVVLVFVIFMGILSVLQCLIHKKTGSNYNVEAGVPASEVATSAAASKADGGKDNKAYDTIDKSKAAKWVNNYVPYGDYPKGGEAFAKQQQETNGTAVIVSDGDEIDFKEVKCDDQPEDSNKKE